MKIKAKFKGFCGLCHYTVWPRELVEYRNKKVFHLDCESAIRDSSPRRQKDFFSRQYDDQTGRSRDWLDKDNDFLEKEAFRNKILVRNA